MIAPSVPRVQRRIRRPRERFFVTAALDAGHRRRERGGLPVAQASLHLHRLLVLRHVELESGAHRGNQGRGRQPPFGGGRGGRDEAFVPRQRAQRLAAHPLDRVGERGVRETAEDRRAVVGELRGIQPCLLYTSDAADE